MGGLGQDRIIRRSGCADPALDVALAGRSGAGTLALSEAAGEESFPSAILSLHRPDRFEKLHP